MLTTQYEKIPDNEKTLGYYWTYIGNFQAMQRRSFLVTASSFALSQLLVGCGGRNQETLKVSLLNGSIPGQVVGKFRKSLQGGVNLNFSAVAQLKSSYKNLQTWHSRINGKKDEGWLSSLPFGPWRPLPVADLVTLGDYWLAAAIEQQLIQPLDVSEIKEWSNLDRKWQELVKRNDKGLADSKGKIWAAPYRWGSTVIVYNRDKFKDFDWKPQDWKDLWRPELRSRVSLLNQSREAIGLTLKKIGKSYNTQKLSEVPQLESELRALNKQVKLYSSDRYIEPLIIGDTWIGVGWSSDVLPLIARYPQLTVVIPSSGTALWADLWVHPTNKNTNKTNLFYKWIDFCLQKDIAKQISLLTKTNSPINLKISADDISQPLNKILTDNSSTLEKSEFLLPLPKEAAQEYDSLFAKIKS